MRETEEGMKRLILPRKWLALIAAALLCVFLLPAAANANSAQPPALVVVVSGADGDMNVDAQMGGAFVPMQRSGVAWESYFTLYYSDIWEALGENADAVPATALRVTVGGKTQMVPLPAIQGRYDSVYTLDISGMTVSEGTLPYRSALLVALRVAITLVVEGLVFFLFGFRQKRSWLVFLIVNLVTQGLLNVALSGSLMNVGYAVIGLIFMEILILLAEIPSFIFLVKESKGWKRALYAVVANLLSLIAGIFLITHLPL